MALAYQVLEQRHSAVWADVQSRRRVDAALKAMCGIFGKLQFSEQNKWMRLYEA